MVNIGGILYSEEEMKDPKNRRKAEITAKRIEQLKEANEQPRDYSDVPTPKLMRLTLATMSQVNWDAGLEELSKRPTETKSAIDEILHEERDHDGVLMFFSRLPVVAKLFGQDYEIDVTKRILDHPLGKRHHDHLLFHGMLPMRKNGSLLDHFVGPDRDGIAVLDRLIEQGRVEVGSKFEKTWRKRLSAGRSNDATRRPLADRVPDSQSTENKREADTTQKNSLNIKILGSVMFGLLLVILVVWVANTRRQRV